MGIFDRFRRKAQPPKRRSYAGINTSRLFADFSTMTRSSDAELKPALRVLRNRCRELSRNDEYVRRYLGLLKTNVVGPHGVNVQAKARNADGSLDGPGNKIVENAWKAWGQRGNCTVDGRLSWTDAQRLFIETLARDEKAGGKQRQRSGRGDWRWGGVIDAEPCCCVAASHRKDARGPVDRAVTTKSMSARPPTSSIR